MLTIDDKVIADIGRGFSVPAQPELLLKLQSLMAEDDPDINVIADTIAQDVAVSATVLKTINSPVYGLARSIADIHKAARYIGVNGILSLVTNTLIKRSFKQNDCGIALEEFWTNASNIANTNVFIGKSIKQPLSSDKLFSIGLFHDCGIPVMAMKYDDYTETYEHAMKTPSETLTSIEESIYQVNHATLGYYVASSWRLPKDICQLILCHHDRTFLNILTNQSEQYYFATLKMAENIVHNHKHFRDASDWAYLQDSIFTLLDIDEEDYQDLLEDSADFQD
ncbi:MULTISPECIES: HDOD domain-containing protein [Thalassotalea]|uniref:HDOD domain-containing protein n=1 Tax=Thalassotalea castellviae TaxID=3075612 RepID=A0ABU2ZZR1_9GAMM|nr:HDOD domain-containing protein [Thalassotalea sp. W431]MDT0603412.1 HDOD domain-containing protein [Thalassotalea sp. W431]